MSKYPILDAIKKGEKILSVQMIDGTNSSLVSYLLTYRNPDSLYDQKHLSIMPGNAIKQRSQMKDPHIHTTKKHIQMEIQSSLMLSETYLPAGNIVEVVVVESKELLTQIAKSVEKIEEKIKNEEVTK